MPEVPNNIKREHLLSAIEEIRKNGIPAGAHSSTYDVVYEGERFPPKLVVSIANRFSNGEDLDRQAFRGGLNTEAFQLLEREGFVVEPKRDQFEAGYQAIRKRFLAELPGFSGFSENERYVAIERGYKDELIRMFDEEVRPYGENEDWAGFGEQIVKLFTRPLEGNNRRPQNIVGWRYFDPLRKLKSEKLAAFGRAVADLLADEPNLEQRLKDFVNNLHEISGDDSYPAGAASRSLISFLLTLSDPSKHLFLKTTEMKKALRFFDPEFRWNGQGLAADELRKIESLATRVFDRLADEGWNPADLVDVQSVFWIATSWYESDASSTKTDPAPLVVNDVGEIMSEPLNQILYGPPGTGKTFSTVNKALKILDPEFLSGNDSDRGALRGRFEELCEKGRIGTVTFHQSFSYEDFVEGLRASADEDGQIQYEIESGIFRRMCDVAKVKTTVESNKLSHKNAWVLIIDEINRGNIANIFGELITLIEPSKREGAEEATEVTLPYSKEQFSVPGNLYIVGTMNTADRSLVHMDTALRRRFVFEAMMPKTQVLSDHGVEEIDGVDIVTMLEVMNQRIELLYDREHTLGHSFFLPLAKTPSIVCLAEIFDRQILPLLEEYFFEDWSRIRQVLGDDQKTDDSTCFVVPVHTESSIQALLSADVPQELMNRAYTRNEVAFLNPDSYRLIYERDEA